MKQVALIGHFGIGLDLLNGQTIKTKIVANELERVLGSEQIFKIDTHGSLFSFLKLPFLILMALCLCKNVIILPAQNGLRIIAPMLYVMNLFFLKKIHYVVIGGWMPSLIEKRKFLTFCLRRFNHIYVETTVMKKTLENLSFSNVCVMVNCKPLSIVELKMQNMTALKPIRFCIFSRVMKQKGIEHAVSAIKKMNEIYGEESCCLDIYGQIEKNEEEWFESLQQLFPKNIAYKGMVAFDKSVEALKCYSALLFPTLFFTEGIPGTIIDAYAAGVPVISSQWASFSDIIDEGVTGFGYEFGSEDALYNVLEQVISSPEILGTMKQNCIAKANLFLPQNAMSGLFANLK